MNMNFFMPTRIITGKGCIIKSAEDQARLGKSCLIVTGSASAKKCGALSDVTDTLNSLNINYSVYDRIKQNPTVESCMYAAIKAVDIGAEFIIGIGGGSPLDAAKAIAVLAANPGMTEDELYSLKWKNRPLPVVAVGTTAGTGSEVTPVSVLTNRDGLKKSIRDDSIYPVLSFGDPQYTMSLPELFTKSTAVDALAHCVESYFNTAANDISKAFAAEGVRVLCGMLRKIADTGTASLNFDDREQLYNASIYGGLAISVTGTAMPHAMGYFLSESHGIPHGTACAVFLPAFIRHNRENVPKLTDEFFSSVGITERKFLLLLEKVTPEYDICVTKAEREALAPRWVNNKGLKKTFGDFSPELADKLLCELFEKD